MNEAIADRMEFIPAGQATGKGMAGGLWCDMLKSPAFRNRDEFGQAINELDTVSKADIFLLDMEKQEADSVDGYFAIKSNLTGKVYSVRSGRYIEVNDSAVATPFLNALTDLNLEGEGRIDGIGTGQTTGNFLIRGKEYEIDFGNGRHDWIDTNFLGVRWWNSYNGTASLGGEICSVRKACTNYCLIGDLLGKFTKPHTGKMDGIEKEFYDLISNLGQKVGLLQDIIKEKEEIKVEEKVMDLALWGIGMPSSAIDDIVRSPQVFVPEAKGELDVHELFKATTAWITYRNNSGVALRTTERMSKDAVKLLTDGYEDILKRGEVRKEAWQEEQRKKNEAELARKATQFAQVQEANRRGN